MGSIRLDKKMVMIIAGIGLVMIVGYFLMAPLLSKVHSVGDEVKVLECEMGAVRQAIQSEGKFQKAGELLTRRKVSLAIDEITKTGAVRNINFLSISPQKIMKPAESKYPVLPIQMDLQSEYSDLGLFLGDLESLEKSIVSVKSFQVDVDSDILPKINTDLLVEVYLQEGEDG